MGESNGPFPVTVCTPAWNEESSIIYTLDSIRAQTWTDIAEVSVCANGCSDATEAVVQQHAKKVAPCAVD